MKNRVTSGSVTVTGSPCSIWSADHGEQRAAAAEDVAEADRADAHLAVGVGLHDHLGQPLGRAQDRLGLGGLVGGDQQQPRRPGLGRRPHHVLGAEHVRLHALARVPLEQRQVLVRGGVEDDIRPDRAEHLPDPGLVPDVGDDDLGAVEQRPPVQLELQRVHVRLVVVEHVQGRRVMAPDLAAQLLADRAAGPGDEDPGAGEHGLHRRLEDPALGPAEQVAEADRAHVRRPCRAFQGGKERRQVAHVRAGVGRGADEAAVRGRRQRRDRDDDRLDLVLADDAAQVGEGAKDRRPEHGPDAGIVVEQADRPQPVVRTAPQVAHERAGRGPGADDQRRESRCRPAGCAATVSSRRAGHGR